MAKTELSPSAHTILLLARRHADRLRSPRLTPEHILLALSDPASDTFTQLLEDQGILPSDIIPIRRAAEERLLALPQTSRPPTDASYTAGAKRILDLAFREIRSTARPRVEPEDLLLAYLEAAPSVAAEQLREVGLTGSSVREWIALRHSQ